MTKYRVKIKCHVYIDVYVTARSKQEAEKKASVHPLQWPHDIESIAEMDVTIIKGAEEVEE